MSNVKYHKITPSEAGQRIDNYLIRIMKGVPKSRIYKALRKGEVRVNKGRINAQYRLCEGDELRLPPIRQAEEKLPFQPTEQLSRFLQGEVIWQNTGLMIVNKPSGMPVHGGSQVSAGLIEMLRGIYPKLADLELVHRLDRDTSGCILLAKKRSALRAMHEQWRAGRVKKRYLAFVKGRWPAKQHSIDLPLQKNVLESGERRVRVDQNGKPSKTAIRVIRYCQHGTLLEANPVTGRTHQIRVHLTAIGHPIAGDEKYGDKAFNQLMRQRGLKRLLLHSASLSFHDPVEDKPVAIGAMTDFCKQLL